MKTKILFACLLVSMFIGICYAEQDDYDTVGWDPTNSRSIWRWNSSGHYIPAADDTYDIGTSALEVRNIYIDGTATIDTLTVDVASTFTGGITTDTLTATGNVTMNDAGADTILIGSATDTVRIYGTLTLGDNGATGEVNTSDWDISETGVMTGIGAITMNGLLTGTAGATITGAAVNLNASSNFAVNVATGSSSGAVAIGGNSNTVAVNSSDWDISTAGAMTNIDSVDNAGTLAISTSASGGNVTVTTNDATGTVSVLTGNLKVGNGSPGVTQDGEDAYVEGTLEVDGAVQFDGNLAVNGGTLSATADLIIDPAGGDIDIDAADLQIDASKKLSLNGATETDYIQSNTNVEIVAVADILLDPAGGDIDVDAADVQLDAGKKLSLNGATETDYIYSSTDVEVGAAADIVLTPAGGQVDVNAADIGVDAAKYVSLAGISALTQASLIYQNSAIEVFVNATNTYDFTAAGLVGQGTATLETGTGATKINGDFQVNDGANKPIGDVTFSNAVDNVTITNSLIDAGSRIFLQAAGVTVGDIYCNTPGAGSVLVGSNTNETADFTVWYMIVND